MTATTAPTSGQGPEWTEDGSPESPVRKVAYVTTGSVDGDETFVHVKDQLVSPPLRRQTPQRTQTLRLSTRRGVSSVSDGPHILFGHPTVDGETGNGRGRGVLSVECLDLPDFFLPDSGKRTVQHVTSE